MQGPISVFDGGEYAGDGQISDIAPNAKRLVSYALDVNTEIAAQSTPHSQRLTSLTVVDGVLHIREIAKRSTVYQLKNSDDRPKSILLEQQVDPEWKLNTPKEATEKTRSLYRFAVDLKGNDTQEFKVIDTREVQNQIALLALSPEQVMLYLQEDVASDKLKQALTQLQELRADVEKKNRAVTDAQQQLVEISAEQERIRANMNSIDKTSDLYKRYIQKFGQQEDQVESLRAKLPELRASQQAATKRMEDFVKNLAVE
jgi:hypothetical protein